MRVHGGTTRSEVLGVGGAGAASVAKAEDTVPAGLAGGGVPLRVASDYDAPPLAERLVLWSADPVELTPGEEGRLYTRLWREVEAVEEPAEAPADPRTLRAPVAWLDREFTLAGGVGLEPAVPRLAPVEPGHEIAAVRIEAIPNPEPATIALYAVGAAALVLLARRRRRRGRAERR